MVCIRGTVGLLTGIGPCFAWGCLDRGPGFSRIGICQPWHTLICHWQQLWQPSVGSESMQFHLSTRPVKNTIQSQWILAMNWTNRSNQRSSEFRLQLPPTLRLFFEAPWLLPETTRIITFRDRELFDGIATNTYIDYDKEIVSGLSLFDYHTSIRISDGFQRVCQGQSLPRVQALQNGHLLQKLFVQLSFLQSIALKYTQN